MANILNSIKKIFLGETVNKQAFVQQRPDLFIRNNMNLTPQWNSYTNRAQYLSNYYDVPEYSAIKNYMATNFAALKWKMKDTITGEFIEDDPVLALLKNPNPFQDQSEFLIQFYLNWKVFGNAYLAKLTPDGFENSSKVEDINGLYILPSQYTHIQGNNINPFYAKTKQELIRGYSVVYNSTHLLTLNPDAVLHKNEPNLDFDLDCFEFMYGKPDQISLDWALANIKAIYEAENVLINNKGPLGIISNDSNAEHGITLPFNSEEKDSLESDLERYGLKSEKLQYIITNMAMKFTAISFPIKDMMLNETFNRAVSALCSSNKFPRLLLNSGEGATFSNQREADKQLYQNALIPQSIDLADSLTNFFYLKEQNKKLIPDFSHVAVLKEDEKLNADTAKTKNDTANIMYDKGLITKNDWLTMMSMPTVNNSDFNKYKQDESTNTTT